MKAALSAALTALVLVAGWNEWANYEERERARKEAIARDEAPVTDWFVVRNLAVADGFAGEDLPAIYDREIKAPFGGTWYAEVRNVESKALACPPGKGGAFYEPKDVLPPAGVTLGWLIGHDCVLTPGQYYLEITYLITPANYPTKTYRDVSNVFNIRSRDAVSAN